MKLISKYIGRRALIVGSVSGLLLLAFQNCGKAGFDSQASSTDASLNGVSSVEKAVPFAYKISFDTLAYNSCFGSTLSSKPNFFTFKAGAYSTGGVRVTKGFVDYANSVLKPSYPSPIVTSAQYKNLLLGSPVNKDAQVQFSMRQLANVQAVEGIYRTGTASPTVGIDFVNLLGPLTDDRWSDALIAKAMATLNAAEPDFSQYFILGSRGYRNLDAKQSFNTDEGLAQSVRNAFRSSASLTLTVQDPDGANGEAKSPTTDVTKAYGTAYQLNFAADTPPYINSCVPVLDATGYHYTGCATPKVMNPAPNALNPDNILHSISETDLETGVSATTAWTCDATMRFMVVRPIDQTVMCPKGEDRTNLDAGRITNVAGYYRDLERIRRVLPADQWDVNLTRRCAVPKDGDCYSSNTINNNLVPVEYNPTKTCFQAIAGINYGVAPVNICAQYVSVCVK